MKILIVDDSPTNVYLCKLTLESLGHEVASAANGCEGLVALTEGSYNCVFSDMQMPQMKGPEFAQKVRSGEAGADNIDIYMVAMSGNTSDEDKALCLKSGMNAFIEKPLSKEKFSEALPF